MSPVPKVVAFDLDGTLWDPEMYQLRGGAPFRRDKHGRVFDSRGEEIHLIGESLTILRELATDPKWKDTQVAYVSRTEYPEWAVPCLKTFLITDNLSMWDVGRQAEIYPGSKRSHFRAIKDKTGTPYNEMLFFDNERWNITDCAPLGITCVYCREGMTPGVWAKGLQQYTAAATANAGATTQ